MIEEAVVAGGAGDARVLGRAPDEAQGREGAGGGLGAGDVAALYPDRVGGECEPDRRDAREGGARRAVRGEAVLRVGQVPEVMKGALLEGVEEGGGVAGRAGRRRATVLLAAQAARAAAISRSFIGQA